ncbi:MAG TPA: hypothetical protein VMM77_12280 [Gemmatimonadaceae bacterium]|nr:hypothetical protein [Gemmatimonadaceae bacterium]
MDQAHNVTATFTFSMPFIATGITDPNVFLERCPANDPAYTQIRQDFEIRVDGQLVTTPIECTEPYATMPTEMLTDELIALQVLRTAYYLSVGTEGKLPWTTQSLYAWMAASVDGINLKTTPGLLYCCDVIDGKVFIAYSRQNAFNRDFKRAWPGITSSLNFYGHEIRHANPGAMGHTTGCPYWPLPTDPPGCDPSYDLANLGSYGLQYWLESSLATAYLNVGIGCLPAATATEYIQWHVNSANNFRPNFVTSAPPEVVATVPHGGPCLK